jgi:hypothetical protein
MNEQTSKHSLWKFLVAVLLLPAAVAPACGQGGFQGSTGNVSGYVDGAAPLTQLRLRFDAVYDINRSDRAEFIYTHETTDPRIDYQEPSAHLEYAFGDRYSAFVELRGHFVNPEKASNAKGLGDMNAGFKWAFVSTEDRIETFQLRVYIPTGDPTKLLGAGHASIEPGLLLSQFFSDNWRVEAMLKDWIPLGDSDFQGNIVNYGAALSYRVFESERMSIWPVAELVGWTVLGGKETLVPPSGVAPSIPGVEGPGGGGGFPTKDAAGDTIVNAKLGARIFMGQWGSFYAGYGRALTGAVWYKDLWRVEYRLAF